MLSKNPLRSTPPIINLSLSKYLSVYSNRLIKEFHKRNSAFIILFIVYLLASSSILQADFYYIDDIARAHKGYRGWEDFSRYTSNFLSVFIHFSKYLSDISPLPQILCIFLLVIASLISIHIISPSSRISIFTLLASIPLGLSPYFLECLSYKYDSPYMALSILASVFPLLFYQTHFLIYLLILSISVFIVCTTYQAATGILPMLVILVSFIRWNEKDSIRSILVFILRSFIGYCIGMILFLSVMRPAEHNYASNTLPSLIDFIPNTIANYQRYFSLLLTDLRSEWIILIVLLVLCFIGSSILHSKRNLLSTLLFSVLTTILLLLLSFGLYPALSTPLFAPRAMYSFGAFIAFLGVYCASINRSYFAKLISIALAWAFITFALSYGNALQVQKEYTNHRISAAIHDLLDLDTFSNAEIKHMQLIGSIGQSSVIQNMPKDYRIMDRLIPIMFADSSWVPARYGFEHYYGLNNIVWENDLNQLNLPISIDNLYHTIYSEDNRFLIELKP